MKKYTLIMVILTSFVMVSCGSGSTTTESSDSTAVQVDTSDVDSTNVGAPFGGVSNRELPVK